MKVDRLRCARLKKNWAGRVFYWEIKGEMENKKRDISNRGVGLFEMCVRGTHTGIILYYLFIILSAKGSFCRMFQHFGYPTEVINAMYSPFPR